MNHIVVIKAYIKHTFYDCLLHYCASLSFHKWMRGPLSLQIEPPSVLVPIRHVKRPFLQSLQFFWMSADKRLSRESEADWRSSVAGHICHLHILWLYVMMVSIEDIVSPLYYVLLKLHWCSHDDGSDSSTWSQGTFFPHCNQKMSKWTDLMDSIWETMRALENVSGERTKDINYSTYKSPGHWNST